ncbi:MAG: sulfotransferase [Oceanospirillaceae bacterium]|nr:sulfotransferase [Oceanospirillaceae bacterium]
MTIKSFEPSVIYIVGSGRSGSTMLDVCLSSNSNITGAGEVHRLSLNPNDRLCGCGEIINKCAFWSKVISDYSEENTESWHEKNPVTKVVTRYRLLGFRIPRFLDFFTIIAFPFAFRLYKKIFRSSHTKNFKFISNSFRLYDSIAKVSGKAFVVDSSKNIFRAKALYLEKPDRTFIVHLVRDGRAIVESAKRRVGASIESTSKEWRAINKRIDIALKNVSKQRKILVRYEDFCLRPQETLARINSFIGNEEYSFNLPEIENSEHHQIPGNPLLMDKVSKVRLDEKWRSELSQSELDEFRRFAGTQNSKYGYD